MLVDPANARPIVSSLLKARVTILPTAPGEWVISGEGTLTGLFERTLPVTRGGYVPNGIRTRVLALKVKKRPIRAISDRLGEIAASCAVSAT